MTPEEMRDIMRQAGLSQSGLARAASAASGGRASQGSIGSMLAGQRRIPAWLAGWLREIAEPGWAVRHAALDADRDSE